MRDGLIELIKQSIECCEDETANCANCKYCATKASANCGIEKCADYLLANGVIVPPCKVGDTVYVIDVVDVKEHIKKKTVCGFEIDLMFAVKTWDTMGRRYFYYFEQFGKTVFLTREEAERALKEREQND